MGWQDAPLADAPPAPTAGAPAWQSAPLDQPGPDMAAGNKTFSRTVGNALTAAKSAFDSFDAKKSGLGNAAQTVEDVGSVYAPIEAALNAGTGLLFGFPAYVGAGLGGLTSKYLLGSGADPKELAETMQKIFTYEPVTQRGQRLAGNVMMPLTMLQQGSGYVGERATDLATKAGASDNVAAAVGAVTDNTIQMLSPALLGELHRKMGGQTVTAEDMSNVAKVIERQEPTPLTSKEAAPGDGRIEPTFTEPERIAAIEKSLHATYEKTGIGPFTVAAEAMKDPALHAELMDPAVEVPKAFEQYVEKPPGSDLVTQPNSVQYPSFQELGKLSDEMQTKIDARHDELDAQGMAWDDQKKDPALESLYAGRITHDTQAAQKGYDGAKRIIESNLGGAAEKTTLASVDSILRERYSLTDDPQMGAYLMSQYTGKALDNPATVGKVAGDLERMIFAREHPHADFNAAMNSSMSGLSQKQKSTIVREAAEKAQTIHDQIRNFFIDNGKPLPGNGAPLLDLSGPTTEEATSGTIPAYDIGTTSGNIKAAGSARPEQELGTGLSGEPEPRGWAGATSASRGSGPVTVWRGASQILTDEHFNPESLGKASGNPGSGLGVWFTTGKEEAARYGDVVEGVHLDVRNPITIKAEDLPGFDSVADATKYRETLQAKGYDGIIVTAQHLGKPEIHLVAFTPDQVIRPKPIERAPLAPQDVSDAIAQHTLDDTPQTRKSLGDVARASEIDPAAVWAAANEHAADEGAFNRAIQEIIDEQERKSAAESRSAPAADESAIAGSGRPAIGGQTDTAAAERNPAGERPDAATDRRTQDPSDPDGVTELHAGINPAAALRGIRDSYTPFVGVEPVKPVITEPTKGPMTPMFDALQKIFAPASRGDIAQQQAGIMRANLGEMAREREVAVEKMKEVAAQFDKLSPAQNIKFIDAMERGTTLASPKMVQAARMLRELLDNRRDEVQALGNGKLENFDENYFPHMWQDPEAAASLFARRPLEGSKGFLKERTIPFTVDGLRWRAYDADGDFVKSYDTEAQAQIAAGTQGRVGKPLKPITTNPVEMALLKVREMDKYIYGQKIFAEMKDADLARFVPFGAQSLPGWVKINDKIARVLQPNPGEGGGMILRGDYYAPEEAGTLMNNHLSPGLQGNGFYDAWRGVGMAMNSLQLGLSAFHVGFTSMDAMVSKVALGMQQLSRGDILQGAGSVAQGLNPAQPFVNIYKGDKLMRAYLGKLDNPDLAPIVDAIQQAGGRVKMDDFYRNATVNTFKQALRNEDYVGAAKAFLPTVLDRISAPIFEELVPRQKLGVYFDMAKDWLEKNPDANVADKRAGLGKLWDSVDNRMGQLVYDNVFWNHALKDGLMATVRSVGWNLGTFRELGGGVLDIKDIARDKGFSSRTGYVVALPVVAAVYGSLMHYAYTGQPPDTLKDAFYPRTGRLRPDGTEDRVSLPTYMKDVFAYGEDATNFAKYGSDPTQTLKNKAHPLISTISQMLNNQDFFGGAIRNPADKAVEQIADEVAFLIQQFMPFSYRNYIQQAKTKGEEPSVMGYLTSPSMVGITPAPGYITKSPEELESSQVSRMRQPLIQKYKEAIKGGADVEKLMPDMIRGGLSKQDIRYIIQSSGETPKPHRLKSFGSTDAPE